MIKTVFAVGTVIVGVAFAAGCYVGWKTTLKVVDDVTARKR